MMMRGRLATLGVMKIVGLVREAAIIAFAVGQSAAGAANCYFLASQAAMICTGGSWVARLAGIAVLLAYWGADSRFVLFSVVVFLPFLLWPRVNKAAFRKGKVRAVILLSVVFNAVVFVEMALAGQTVLGFTVPNLFGVPFIALYVTVLGGALVFGLADAVEHLIPRDLLILLSLCAVRIAGFGWMPSGYEWMFLAVTRVLELVFPQWITLKRIGVRA